MPTRTMCAAPLHVASALDAAPSVVVGRSAATLSGIAAMSPAVEKTVRGGGLSFDPMRVDGDSQVDLCSQIHNGGEKNGRDARMGALPLRTPVLCAVAVRAGRESAVARRVLRVAEGAALDAFVLRRELMRREEGAWRVRRDVLFPGYVIVETHDPELLAQRLEILATQVQVLRGAGNAVATLTEHEAAMVRALGGRTHTVGVSVGEIVSNRLNVISGPLMGLEGLVTKINRHKRIAYLDATVFSCLSKTANAGCRLGRCGSVGQAPSARPVRVALEVVSKV